MSSLMIPSRCVFFGSLGLAVLGSSLLAAQQARFGLTVSHELTAARPGEVIVIPFSEVRRRLPNVQMHHLQVREVTTGAVLPSQVTNFVPDDRRALYNDLVFQYDFAAGQTSARFVIETTDAPVPPFQARVFARYIPERLDDFAWENDRMGHRIYGPGLDTPAAGRSRMISSGVDFWAKRVRYPIVDRWYLKGHDAYHVDDGEGMDFYSVGTSRGVGGTGVWAEDKLHVSHNWSAWRVLANGPIRAVFEIDYAPWHAGNVTVRETKRFVVDAGRNLDRIESTFTFEGAADAVTVAIGLGTNAKLKPVITRRAEQDWLSDWSVYANSAEGALGTGVVLEPGTHTGFAQDPQNHLILTRARSGDPVIYYAGAGWSHAGDFRSQADWEAYLASFAQRLRTPVTITLDPVE
jgi:hypothetical protein